MLVVGTYTEKVSNTLIGKGKGVYFFSWDSQDGKAQLINFIPITNVSYMAFSRGYNCLYLAEELLIDREPKFQVYKYDGQNGPKYDLLQEEVLRGSSACHMDISEEEDEISVACYTSGNAEIFKILPDGRVSHKQTIVHRGKGPNRLRQESAHPHMVKYKDKQLHIVDLGIDKVKTYEKKSGIYKERPVKEIQVKQGSGARHMVQTKDGATVLVLSELSGEVYIYQRTGERYDCIQELNVLSDNFKGIPSAAAIRMSKDEHIVYVSERASSTIIVIEKQSDKWKIIQRIDSGGVTPRDINIDPSNNWLIVANQDSHKLSCFAIGKESGKLKLKHHISVPSPACLLWHQ